MTDYEIRRIAQIYGASEQEVRDAERLAAEAPMVPVYAIVMVPETRGRMDRRCR